MILQSLALTLKRRDQTVKIILRSLALTLMEKNKKQLHTDKLDPAKIGADLISLRLNYFKV